MNKLVQGRGETNGNIRQIVMSVQILHYIPLEYNGRTIVTYRMSVIIIETGSIKHNINAPFFILEMH